MADLQATIAELWTRRADLTAGDPDAVAAVHEAIGLLDRGEARIAEIDGAGAVIVEIRDFDDLAAASAGSR